MNRQVDPWDDASLLAERPCAANALLFSWSVPKKNGT